MTEEISHPDSAKSCPKCRCKNIARKISSRTVLMLFVLLIVGGILLGTAPLTYPATTHTLTLVLALAFTALLLMAPIALLVAGFGKRMCRECGHRWRR